MRKYFTIIISVCVLSFLCAMVACKNEEPVVDDGGETQWTQVVKTGDDEILISVFWPPMTGFATDEQYQNLVDAKIDLLEWGSDPIFTNNETIQKTLELCEKYGIDITICDSTFGDLTTKAERSIIRIVDKYKEYPCVVGYYLRDEPRNANPYGRVTRILTAAHPGAICQVNMLPMWALTDPKGHAEDWINAAGPENLRYLSFDQYPFGLAEGSVPQIFPNVNFVRLEGLKYGVDTALYIQSVGVVGSFRRPTVSETRYHTSAALAYGFKNLKYFTWMTPVDRGVEVFTDAIITPTGEKSETYQGIKEINTDIKKVADILGNLDALEIYHNGRVDNDTEPFPLDWFITPQGWGDYMISLMKDRTNGRNFIMVVNKDYKDSQDITFTVSSDITYLVDVTEGIEAQNYIGIGQDATVTASVIAGGFRLYAFAEGIDKTAPYKDAHTTNLAYDKPVLSSSSEGENGMYNCKAVDSLRISNSSNYGWHGAMQENVENYFMIDLMRVVEFNRLDIYPAGLGSRVGRYFPASYRIMVSTDGANYTEVKSESFGEGWQQTEPISYNLGTQNARYVKIVIDQGAKVGSSYVAEFAEIEIYNDDGSIPAPSL